MSKILIVNNLFPPDFIGGYELIALDLAEAFVADGHDVAVATSPLINSCGKYLHQNFQVYRSLRFVGPLSVSSQNSYDVEESRVLVNMDNIFALAQVIDDFEPDRVLLCNIDGLGVLGICSFFHFVGLSTTVYLADNIMGPNLKSLSPQRLKKFFDVFAIKDAIFGLKTIALSEGVFKESERSLGMRLTEPLYVPGWIETNLPAIKTNLPSNQVRFVYSSRIAPHKGILILLDAARLLMSRGEANFRIDLYGGGAIPSTMQRAHAMGLRKHISFCGTLERGAMLNAFDSYDALLFPVWEREPLGLVPFEAGARGCLPIVTQQAGACEWLTNAECIKICRTPEGLAGAMQSVLHMSPLMRYQRRHKAAENIRSLFSAKVWFPRIAAHLLGGPDKKGKSEATMVRDSLFTITKIWQGV